MTTTDSSLTAKTALEIRRGRLRRPTLRSCITVACLWPKTGANLGTLARSVDAVGANMVVPTGATPLRAMRLGNTIGLHNTLWSAVDPEAWLRAKPRTHTIVAVELASDAVPLRTVGVATNPTVLVIGNETTGIPGWALELCDYAVEIPMSGVGNSLNVAVAASLVLYKMGGLS